MKHEPEIGQSVIVGYNDWLIGIVIGFAEPWSLPAQPRIVVVETRALAPDGSAQFMAVFPSALRDPSGAVEA